MVTSMERVQGGSRQSMQWVCLEVARVAGFPEAHGALSLGEPASSPASSTLEICLLGRSNFSSIIGKW